MRFAIVVLLSLWCAIARAEDLATYEVDGEAASGGSDPRVAALDDAFSRAVTAALAELVSPATRTAKKQDLDREVVGRARLWVSKFTVVKDETNDDRRQLTVAVRVDRDKMRARLTELGISIAEEPAPSGRARPIALFVRVSDGESIHGTYGSKAESDVAGAASITSALKAAGFAAKRSAAGSPAKELDDDDAENLAVDIKADAALVASVTIGAPVAVRGQPHDAILVGARIRLLDLKSKTTIEGRASFAALDASQAAVAVDRAVRAALADILPSRSSSMIAQPTGFHGDDTPITSEGVVLVRVAAKTPLTLVLAEQKFLANTKGVSKATIRRLSPGGWIIGLSTTQPIDAIASVAKKPPAKDTRASAKVVGDIVEVSLVSTAPVAPGSNP